MQNFANKLEKSPMRRYNVMHGILENADNFSSPAVYARKE